MKFLTEYRDPEMVEQYVKEIKAINSSHFLAFLW